MVVTDDGTPNLSDSETITVTVNEVNVAPVLDAVGDQTVDEQTLLIVHGDGDGCGCAGQYADVQSVG